MKVYDFEGFPNPLRVRVALKEKGVFDQIDFVTVDVPNGEHRQADFLAKNPSGAVPAMELDDGTVISECTAITEYIDHSFDGISLTGSSAKERAVVHMMQRRAEQDLLDAAGTCYHHATDGLGPDLETYQNKEWGNKQGERALKGMHYFDSVLADNSFVAGENFSMADITVFAGLVFAGFAQIDIPQSCTNLLAWQERMASRPSFAA